MLIAEKVTFAPASSKYQSKKNNTAAYLKLEAGQPYKFYSLLLVPELDEKSGDTKLRYTWRIKDEYIYHEDLKIPDDAIIVCYKPEWITNIRGTDAFELPIIEVSPRVLELCGSEQSFKKESAQIMLASLDSDTLHAIQDKQSIRQEDNRITIAAPMA